MTHDQAWFAWHDALIDERRLACEADGLILWAETYDQGYRLAWQTAAGYGLEHYSSLHSLVDAILVFGVGPQGWHAEP